MKNVIKTPRVYLALILALMVVGLLAGCTSSDSENTNSSTKRTTAESSGTQETTTESTTTPTTEATTETTTPPTLPPATNQSETTPPATKPQNETPTPATNPTDPVWKYNNPTLTEVHEYLYAHWRSITVYDRMAICTGYFGSTVPILSMGNTIGELGFNEKVICTGEYDNGWFRIEYAGQTAYVESAPLHELYHEPVLFTYKDGTTGTVAKDGATYIDDNGTKQTYEARKDDAGRPAGEICALCGKEVTWGFREGSEPIKYCHYSGSGTYCEYCGKKVPTGTCHDCIAYFDGSKYCNYCGKVDGDGINGTCQECYAADYLGYKAGDTVTAGDKLLTYLGNDEWRDEEGTIWYSYDEFGIIQFYRWGVNGTA